jgi:hypothetical protein
MDGGRPSSVEEREIIKGKKKMGKKNYVWTMLYVYMLYLCSKNHVPITQLLHNTHHRRKDTHNYEI